MKKNLFLLMLMLMGAFATFSFTSCSDDDDETVVQDTNIVGSWQEDDTTDGIWVWTFNKNGSGTCRVTDNGSSYSFSFKYTYDGTTLVITGEEDGETYTDTYTVIITDGSHITLVDGSYRTTFTRVK